jgi:hypothetical protein
MVAGCRCLKENVDALRIESVRYGLTGKPEVMPPGWQITHDKRASKNRCIADDKPIYRYLSWFTRR